MTDLVFVDQESPPSAGMRTSRGLGEESLSKAVSRNITMILEDLLKDYDKTERPSYKEGCCYHLEDSFNYIYQDCLPR